MKRHFARAATVVLLVLPVSLGFWPSGSGARAEGAYALDEVSREVNPKGPVRCPDLPLIAWEGKGVKWHKPLRVHPDFAKKIEMFEAIVAKVAERHYGRAPDRIRHLGSYLCRRISRYPHLVSEHGMGNAVDIAGFHFKALRDKTRLPRGAPAALARAFDVTVLKNWTAPQPKGRGPTAVDRIHSAFLRDIAAALDARPDIFRVMLGPGYPGHKDHFHFDMAPYRLVAW